MPVQLGSRPEHGFDQPLGLLSDCHRRIENFLAILQRVVDQADGAPLNDEQRRAIDVALEYFRSAAPRHTADEEQSLFPLLRGSDRPDVQAALQTVQALERDHEAADQAHAEIDAAFGQWIEAGSLTPAQTTQLVRTLGWLRQLYARHIAVEDQEIFPLAAQVLTPQELAQIGKQMAERRGVSPA